MSKPVDPHAMGSQLEQVLCVLFNANLIGIKWSTAADLSRTLRDEWGLGIHWRTVQAMLDGAKDCVSRKKMKGRWTYSLLAAGTRLVGGARSSIQLVDPRNAVQNVVTLHGLLGELTGVVKICDAYLDEATIEHLDSCRAKSLMLLTHNIRDSGKLRQLLTAIQADGRTIEVRKTKKAELHDRYICDGKRLLILGASLNGFGKKQSFVVEGGPDIRAALEVVFDQMWQVANRWP